MSIERGRGNLLEADVDALVNTVNTEGVMGKGLALQFKKAFPENFASYERDCAKGEVTPGRMHVVQRLASPRYIFNFPTKKHWRQPSKLEYIRDGLEDLVAQAQKLSTTFEKWSPSERQELIWKELDDSLTPAERTKIVVIVTDTPDEFEAIRNAATG